MQINVEIGSGSWFYSPAPQKTLITSPVIMHANHKQVVIIGGGAIGLCCAYYILKRGTPVTIIERGQPQDENCSTGNAGMIVPSHFIPLAAPGMLAKGLRWMLDPRSPFFIRPRLDLSLARWGWLFYRNSTPTHTEASRDLLRDLNMESRRLFSELASENQFPLVQRGLLMLCRTSQALDEETHVATIARDIGLRADVLDARQTAIADPACTMNVAGSIHFHDDCHIDPARFLASMRSRVLSLGAQIINGTDIIKLEPNSNRVSAAITHDNQRIEGSDFILAAGSWSARLLSTIGIRLPLLPGKGYSLTLPHPPQLPGLCSIFCEDKVAVTPIGSSLRFAGTMEIGDLNLKVNPMRVQGIIRSIPRYLPEFSESLFQNISPWAGLRPVSPDGIPYIGRLKHLSNLIVNTGHAMMGISLAPVSGRLAADILANAPPFRPINSLSPGRF